MGKASFDPAYWQPAGNLLKVRVVHYVGDGTNSRLIDLGDVYDWVRVVVTDDKSSGDTVGMVGEAIPGTVLGNTVLNASPLVGVGGAASSAFWEGKETGPGDETKVLLGTLGDSPLGFNRTGWEYAVYAFKFRNVIESTVP